jgi:iron complex outermembrane recepter protein
MSKRSVNKTLSLAIAAVLYAATVQAQEAPQSPEAEADLETVVITGSYIRGTPEDSALLVDVVTAEDLEAQGSPSIVQFVKTVTAGQAALGEANRFVGGAGTANINLRGLGAARTLVLMNNRRLTDNPLPGAPGANLNFIPTVALGRVEILKEGAAATYGSDAIGGVVNFITRTDLDGLELTGEYSAIEDSDGDYQAGVAWGSKLDNGNVLFTYGYRHRSRLDIRDRDWALQPFESAAYGGWSSGSNPGVYVDNTSAGTARFRDNGCAELGGVLTSGGVPVGPTTPLTTIQSTATTCLFQFTPFNDLVDIENHHQFHGEVNVELSDSVTFHNEVTWARDVVPRRRITPANTFNQSPTPINLGGTSGSVQAPSPGQNNGVRYNVPAYHPGLIDLYTTCAAPLSAAQCASAGAAGGVDISSTLFRFIANAGHPTNRDRSDHQKYDSKAFRISSELKGEFHGADWNTAVTYMNSFASIDTNDLLVNRVQQGLNGFASRVGDPNQCTPAEQIRANAGSAAAGCYFFNPFTNSVAISATNGAVNPYYRGNVNPLVNNDPLALLSLYGNYVNEYINEIFVVDGVLSGKSGLELWGGEIGWAVGVQYRHTNEENEFGDLFDNETTPCVDSIDDDLPTCQNPNGPLIFFGSNTDSKFARSVYAGFAELALPVAEWLDVSAAFRYEEYPGNVGSTSDPKISFKFQPLDWIALRGSVGSTFRAPPQGNVSGGCNVGVAQLGGRFRAVETCSNENLRPEIADSLSAGLIFNVGGFTATVDYYYFEFEKELAAESALRLYNRFFGVTAALPTGTPANCTNPALATLRDRFTFAGACSGENVTRIRAFQVNGPATVTSGYDVRLQYDWPELAGGAVTIGAEATYLAEYKRGAFTLLGDPTVEFSAAEDRAGKHDLIAQFFSFPKLRGNAFLSYTYGDFNVRYQGRYIDGTSGALGTAMTRGEFQPDGSFVPGIPIGKTEAFIQHDITLRFYLPSETSISFSAQNFTNEDPSDAPSHFNYDYFNGNPLGSVFELSFRQKF